MSLTTCLPFDISKLMGNDTLLTSYVKQAISSYDPSKPNPSLAKVKASLLSLTLLKQNRIAELIGTKYDVYKAQRYRQDFKDLEAHHRKQFAAIFVEELVAYTRRNTAGNGIVHDETLHLFSDVVIFSDELMESIYERLSTEEVVLLEEKGMFGVFINDVFSFIMNVRRGNIAIGLKGEMLILNKKVIKKEDHGHTLTQLEHPYIAKIDLNVIKLALDIANLMQRPWRADKEVIKEGLALFLDRLKGLL